MSYRPGDFLLGVIEFFSIVLPAALLLTLQYKWWWDPVREVFSGDFKDFSWVLYIAVFGGIYLSGHIILAN